MRQREPARAPGDPDVQVGVTSDQGLVAETVGLGLAQRGMDVVLLPWLRPADESAPILGRHLGPTRHQRRSLPNVGLLLSELTTFSVIREAQRVIGTVRTPWLVHTAAGRGPAWGAMLESGAVLVVATATLDEIRRLLLDVVAGRRTTTEATKRALISQWREFAQAHEGVGDTSDVR